jgi:hypothetical protein
MPFDDEYSSDSHFSDISDDRDAYQQLIDMAGVHNQHMNQLHISSINRLGLGNQEKISVTFKFEQENFYTFYRPVSETSTFSRDKDFSDVSAWRNIGGFINNTPNIVYLDLDLDVIADGHPAAECLLSLCNELRQNKHIVTLKLCSFGAFLFDIGSFLVNNQAILHIYLQYTAVPVTPEQCINIAEAIRDVHLLTLSIKMTFPDEGPLAPNEGSFHHIVSTCTCVEELKVLCMSQSHIESVGLLLLNPSARLRALHLEFSANTYRNFNAMSDMETFIIPNLVRNRQLRELFFHCSRIQDGQQIIIPLADFRCTSFDRLLCNVSSIENICNSNHTIEKIAGLRHEFYASECTKEYLQLNMNEKKTQVIQNKIVQYYLAAGSHLGPFENTPLSVLAKVLSLGSKTRNQQTAIFNLLRAFPEICNSQSSNEMCNIQSVKNSHLRKKVRLNC